MLCWFLILVNSVGAVPLQQSNWVTLAFNKIPANQVSFQDGKIALAINKSAGPLVHKFDRPMDLKSLKVVGEWKGLKPVETGAFDEDSILRVGLVVLGDKKLNAVKRMFAADWVKKLFALAPEGAGLDKIYFFNLTNRADLVGVNREHPKSDLIVEKIVKAVPKEGPFEMDLKLDEPLKTAALWLSVDGDDTQSKFDLVIQEISVQ